MSKHFKDQSGQDLARLSAEVNRIADKLARISNDPLVVEEADRPKSSASKTSVSAVNSVIRARRLRDRYFTFGLFADPAWDILLDLLESELSQRRTSVSSVCGAAAVPATTALRWLKAMEEKGLVTRVADPLDGRRVFVELAPVTSEAMHAYFAALRELPLQ